jgi:prepilin-type N-terminal cleavage/methylation domain-containing protein/prepilin-type processing-associated H-X9-DG protein
MKARVKRPGFSLIELIVVMGLIGIVMSLLLSAVQQSRSAATRLACQNNLKQMALALHTYHDSHHGLPPRPSDWPRYRNLTWMTFLLPYIEQQSLWIATEKAYTVDSKLFYDPPHIGLNSVVKLYVCPADSRLYTPLQGDNVISAAYGSYLGVSGKKSQDGVLGSTPGINFSEITDGTSATVMIGERPPPTSLIAGRWYQSLVIHENRDLHRGPDGRMPIFNYSNGNDPYCIGPLYAYRYGRLDNTCDRYHFWSLHSGGANFAFADGSVRFLRYSAADILPALATRAGGEVVSLE